MHCPITVHWNETDGAIVQLAGCPAQGSQGVAQATPAAQSG